MLAGAAEKALMKNTSYHLMQLFQQITKEYLTNLSSIMVLISVLLTQI